MDATTQAALLLRKQLKGEHQNFDFASLAANAFLAAHVTWKNINSLHWTPRWSPELSKHPVDGFSAGLEEDNLFEWVVTIIGPPETL